LRFESRLLEHRSTWTSLWLRLAAYRETASWGTGDLILNRASPAAGRRPDFGKLFILPVIGAQMGLDLNVVSQTIAMVTNAVIAIILRITGHG
jgi:hypothetical protein